jgi:acetyltransferase-like isoleucine patch superfamily enzyme
MASGRIAYSRYSSLIKFVQFTVSYFPRFFLEFIYQVSFVFCGKFGAGVRYVLIAERAGLDGPAYIGSYTTLKNVDKLKVGCNFSLHEYCYLDAAGGIRIGDNVSIAHHVSILSAEHTWANLDVPIKYNPVRLDGVSIGSDVWIGCGVRILAGTFIEPRTIIAAGAVVKGHLESGFIYGGIPAKKLKKL